ncbi:hypothetical protein ABID22_002690 [Pontibacter aydingkolensis]
MYKKVEGPVIHAGSSALYEITEAVVPANNRH